MFKIKQFDDYQVTKIEKGWSGDQKYLLEKGSEKLMLRISDISKYEKKRHEFEVIKKLEQMGIETSKAVEFGLDDEETHVWMTLTWIEGQDLRDEIGKFSDSQLYDFGIEAGKVLRDIHQLEIPEPEESWEVHFNKKIDRKLKVYANCELKIPGGEAFLSYIEENRHLLTGRPQCFHHGDYHNGNMILTPDEKVIPIDFNRLDIGDPWEDFNRIVFCKDVSPAFASGRVDGYFDGNIPDEFWRLLALYISSNAISSVPWAIPFGEGEIEFMMKQSMGILEDYDNMKTYVPSWYKGGSRSG